MQLTDLSRHGHRIRLGLASWPLHRASGLTSATRCRPPLLP
ncbi:hypothetical protein [Ornithinimicrobium kibberense]